MIYLITLLVLAIIPFSFAIKEVILKRDILPLNVDLSFVRDPRFFGKSFREKVKRSINEDLIKEALSQGIQGIKVMFSEDEMQIVTELKIGNNAEENTVYFVLEDAFIGEKSVLNKEIYAKGNVYVGANSEVRAIASDKDVFLGKNVIITRWIDALGSIFASEGSYLGVNASSEKTITLSKGVKFERVYAKRIQTYNVSDKTNIGDKGYIIGTIKSSENLEIKGNIEIVGNLIGEENINLFDLVSIKGNVFAQGNIIAKDGVRIGSENKEKSLVSNGKITLGEDVVVFGYISSEGGKVE